MKTHLADGFFRTVSRNVSITQSFKGLFYLFCLLLIIVVKVLFLILLREELAEWYSALEKELDSADGPMSPSELAELLAGTLSERPELTRFLSFEALVLEQNLDAMEAFRFRHWRRDRLEAIGAILEESVDGLDEGTGIRVLHRAQLLTAALKPAADPRGVASYEVGDPDFAAFAIDLENELRSMLLAFLNAENNV